MVTYGGHMSPQHLFHQMERERFLVDTNYERRLLAQEERPTGFGAFLRGVLRRD